MFKSMRSETLLLVIVCGVILAMSVFGITYSHMIEQREVYNEYAVNKLKETSYFLLCSVLVMTCMVIWYVYKDSKEFRSKNKHNI